jgi:8-oxo-dGTP pyrophosphatase MutT (NUDIX family)
MGRVIDDVRGRLRAALDPAPRPRVEPGDRLAAVLALMIQEPTPELLLTERALGLSRHAGEVSFPGGLQEPDDGDLLATALRETREEIGLDPAAPEILGALAPVHTFVSGILVTPFVGAIRELPPLTVSDAEIARVLTVPIHDLVRAEERRELHRANGRVWQGWWYETGGVTVWGATGLMLHQLLEVVRREAPWLAETA